MHPEQHTELDNLITMQHNLRTSAKGSNDAYDVSVSLTVQDDSSPLTVCTIQIGTLLRQERGARLNGAGRLAEVWPCIRTPTPRPFEHICECVAACDVAADASAQ